MENGKGNATEEGCFGYKFEMNNKETQRSLNEKMTIGILVALVITNAVWLATSEYSSPLFALIIYAVIAFLCWRRSHFQAGIIVGIIGLGVHIYELLSQGIIELRGFELGLFFINLTFPIPLIYFSYRAYQEIKRRGAKI